MKIDFTISSLRRGGGERVLVTVANNLVNRGFNVKVIIFIDAVEYNLDKKIKLIKLNTGFFSNETLRYTHELFKIYRKKNARPDILISFMTQTNLSAIIVARLFKIKVIASEHTNHSRTSTSKKLVDFTRKYVYKLANKVTILTSYDLSYYKKIGCDVIILPNPCSFNNKFSNKKISKEKTILAVGSLNKYKIKGFDNLLKLITPILKKHTDWNLMIVGESSNVGEVYLKDIAHHFEIQEQVSFAGLRDDVQEIMAKCEIFVLSSRAEGLPMVLIEAMSQNMCCIAYDCISGPSDIITNKVNGILVDDQNSDQMTYNINRLIENPKLRKNLSNKANEVIAKFDENLICDKWEYLINNL